jgi:FAD/FMN-containing dehydrogenase
VSDYAGVLALLERARSGFASQLTAFEVMWPDFYGLATRGLGRKPPLPTGSGLYVLIETMGPDEIADPTRFESVITQALETGTIQDAVVAQSQRETVDLWAVRDSPGEWRQAGHWPQLSFDVSVSTGEIGDLVSRIREVMTARWPDLFTIYFGHVADGNLHLSVRLSDEAGLTERIEAAVYGVVSEYGGSISAEHGIGSLKKEFLHLSRSPEEIALMRTLKRAMDPNGILNPGKIF